MTSPSAPSAPSHISPGSSAGAFFTAHHRTCDLLWATIEAAVEQGDATTARDAYAQFESTLRLHLAMEEEVLFPAFEEATGMTMGPTRVMRMEHVQMRGLLSQMAAAAAANLDALIEHGDTLLMITQQHNLKEEGVLYPMVDAHLGSAWPEIAHRLEGYLRT